MSEMSESVPSAVPALTPGGRAAAAGVAVAAHRPARRVIGSGGTWRWAEVTAQHDLSDGQVRYQVDVDLSGTTQVTSRTYAWPQEGLRVARRSTSTPTDRMPVVPPASASP
ncbi:hypothetical protein [Streptomyces sp. NPDC053560]|uniref:hypothetical protein n=1 Tax=Streptomyces sp. NPDC053560 TaxID=3365711 RepID=UPI0037D91F03